MRRIKCTAVVVPFTATLYTDGSCLGNPGVGGWAYLMEIQPTKIAERTQIRRACGGVPATTNNRMELQAVVSGLHATPFDATVKIVTDSQYVIQVARPGASVTANKELVEILLKLCSTRKVTWEWVKAHNGHLQNTAVDAAAHGAATAMRVLVKQGK